jgi:holo-[acyl-carrier protein] synthase
MRESNSASVFAEQLSTVARELIRPPVGIGIDVVDVAEFERLLPATHAAFYQRCFTDAEIAYCSAQADPAQHFAARFAAKEAAVKAIAAQTQLAYWQIEVEKHADGRPVLTLWTFDRTSKLRDLEHVDLKVSLSHSDTWAAAMVVASERADTNGD